MSFLDDQALRRRRVYQSEAEPAATNSPPSETIETIGGPVTGSAPLALTPAWWWLLVGLGPPPCGENVVGLTPLGLLGRAVLVGGTVSVLPVGVVVGCVPGTVVGVVVGVVVGRVVVGAVAGVVVGTVAGVIVGPVAGVVVGCVAGCVVGCVAGWVVGCVLGWVGCGVGWVGCVGWALGLTPPPYPP